MAVTYSKFAVHARKLKAGLRYVTREYVYTNVGAPGSTHDISVHTSLAEAESAVAELAL